MTIFPVLKCVSALAEVGREKGTLKVEEGAVNEVQ
jgi:hypothetical protein